MLYHSSTNRTVGSRFDNLLPGGFSMNLAACFFAAALFPVSLLAQSLSLPWSTHGHDPQHTAISSVASQPLNQIRWQTPVDLSPQYTGSSLLIHYGSPLI